MTISPIEELDYESILAEHKAALVDIDPGYTALTDEDPGIVVLSVGAYRELAQRARQNEQVRQLFARYAVGGNLDAIGNDRGVERRVLVEADPAAAPPIEEVLEDDDTYRDRIRRAPDAYSVAGPTGAYEVLALAHPGVVAVKASSPAPHEALVALIVRGTYAPVDVIAEVTAVLSADNVRPMTDELTVAEAVEIPYAVSIDVYAPNTPDIEALMTGAAEAVTLYATQRRVQPGANVWRSALKHHAHSTGADRVVVTSPPSDVIVAPGEVAVPSSIALHYAGPAPE